MSKGLKGQVLSGMIWRFLERISAQLVGFIVSIILARLIEPSKYGVVSLTLIFITFANVFVTDGFGKTLIQKKNADNIDFSTVFYFNLLLSTIIYGCIFILAPYIAEFYKEPLLVSTLRVLSLRIPLSAVNSIQQSYVSRNMMFKRFFWSTLIGTIISAIVGICMAFQGFGVWALIAQYLTNTLTGTLVLWFTVRWRPILVFNVSRLKELIGLGLNILFTGLLNSFYNNLRSLIIGRQYSSADLAQYTKGIQYPNLIVSNLNTAISSVLYPALSKLQDDKLKLKQGLRKAISMNTFIVFPLMLGLYATAPELIELVLTKKWLPCVPYLRIACIYLSLYPINTANLQAVIAVGEGKIYFRLSLVKKIIGIILIILFMPFGVVPMAFSEIIASILAVLTNLSVNRKLLNYTFSELFQDIGKNLIMAMIMCIIVMCAGYFLLGMNMNYIFVLILKIILGILIFLIIVIFTKSTEFEYLLSQIKLIKLKCKK